MEGICVSKFGEPKCTWKILGLRNLELKIRTANCFVKLVIYNQYNILLIQRHCCSNCIWCYCYKFLWCYLTCGWSICPQCPSELRRNYFY